MSPKTFPFGQDKIGFVVSHPDMTARVGGAVDVTPAVGRFMDAVVAVGSKVVPTGCVVIDEVPDGVDVANTPGGVVVKSCVDDVDVVELLCIAARILERGQT